jgi:TfoX/Sxy family transcriptional regulator of competence genes
MPTDPFLLERIQQTLQSKKVKWIEKKMFGGHCIMVDNKMCFGTYKGGIMARVAPEEVEGLCSREGAGQMLQKGRPMTGYLFLEPLAFDTDENLAFWIDKCLAFNPRAKSSRN